jgi:pSer/pThr/pTyr-binding forkhead associated (FHA) protein
MTEKIDRVEAKSQHESTDNIDRKNAESNAGSKLRDEADEQARQQLKEKIERARKAEEEARKAREEAERKAQEAVEALRKADAEHKLEAAQKAQEASQNLSDSRRQESAAVKAREAVEVAPAPKNADKTGLNGVFKSPDGKESYQIVAGELKEKDGKVIGKINENGQLTLAKDGSTIALNSFREGWRFEGTENGQKRSFETRGDMTHGKIFIPGKDGVAVEYEVRMGMVINKATGEQYGSIKPPTEDANGRFAGGSLTTGQPPQEIALRDIKNAVFSLKVDGQSGVEGRELRGVSLGPVASGADKKANETNGFLNIGEALDAERRAQEQYHKKVEANTGFNFSMAYVTGEQDAQRQADSAGEKAASIRIAQLEKLAAHGQVDQAILNNFAGAAVEKTNVVAGDKGSNSQGEEKDGEAQTKKIELPKLDSEQAAKSVNGQLRLGTDSYQIKNGQLFKVHHGNDGTSVEDTPSGRLGPGYTVLLPGREPIQLANENRVLMEITVGDSNTKHRIVGLGSTRTSEAIGRVGGGLVEVDELLRQANEAKERALAGDKDYFENRPYLTGGLANWAIGDRDQMLKDFASNIDLQTKALHKELDGLFAGGLSTENFGNNKLDLYVKSTQLLMHSIGTSATTATDLAADGKQMQKLVNDSAVMVATTIATAGTGALLGAAVNAGKIGIVAAVGTEIAADTALGAGISVVGRMSDKSNALENAESGAIEGFAMSLGSVGGKIGNELTVARSLALGKAEAGLNLTRSEQLLAASAGKYTNFGLKAAYKIADAGIQTTAFTASGAIRDHDWSGFNGRNIALGTAWMLAGQGIGHVTGEGAEKVLGVGENSLAKRVLNDTVMGYTNSSLGAMDQAWQMERQRIAKELNYASPDQVPLSVLYSRVDYTNILKTMNEAGVSGITTAPLLSLGGHAVEQVAEHAIGIRRAPDGHVIPAGEKQGEEGQKRAVSTSPTENMIIANVREQLFPGAEPPRGLANYQIEGPSGPLQFEGDRIVLGRMADVADNRPHISRTHAEIINTDRGPQIVNHGKQPGYGTYVNGKEITRPFFLKEGDVITLGPPGQGVPEFTWRAKQESNENSEQQVVKNNQGENVKDHGREKDGPQKLAQYELRWSDGVHEITADQQEQLTIGRQSGKNHLVIGHDGVSRQHAVITYTNEGPLLTDLGSTNGTRVNGEAVPAEGVILKPGDKIKLGAYDKEIVFAARPETANAKEVPQAFKLNDYVRVGSENGQIVGTVPGDKHSDKVIVRKEGGSGQALIMQAVPPMTELTRVTVTGLEGLENSVQLYYHEKSGDFYSKVKLPGSQQELILPARDLMLVPKANLSKGFVPVEYTPGCDVTYNGKPATALGFDQKSGDAIIQVLAKRPAKNFIQIESIDTQTGMVKAGQNLYRQIELPNETVFQDDAGRIYRMENIPGTDKQGIYLDEGFRAVPRDEVKLARQSKKASTEGQQAGTDAPRTPVVRETEQKNASYASNTKYAGAHFELDGQPLLLNGREPNLDSELKLGRSTLSLEQNEATSLVSGEHTRIKWDAREQSFYLEDFSTNGTYVKHAQDEQFTRVKGSKDNPKRYYLAPGDEIRLGSEEGPKVKFLAPNFSDSKTPGPVSADTHIYFDGQPIAAQNGEIRIGRVHQDFGNENQRDILNRLVAREHARVTWNEKSGTWELEDLTKARTSELAPFGTVNLQNASLGNGTYVKRPDGRVDFVQGGKTTIGPNDEVHFGSPNGPQLKIVSREGTALEDGRVRIERDNLDQVLRRPDGSAQIVSRDGSGRIEDVNGRVIQAKDSAGTTRTYGYADNQLRTITFSDGSSIESSDGMNWTRKKTDGAKESWWKGKIEVEADGSLKYTDDQQPAVRTVERLDGTRELVDANGRTTYKILDFNRERASLEDLKVAIADNSTEAGRQSSNDKARQRRFVELMDQFEERAVQDGLSREEVAQTYHQVGRLLRADDGAYLSRAERARLAEQILYQAVNPKTIDQGANKTCNVTTVEKRIFSRQPSEAARLIVDVATTGKYVTADGHLIDLSRVPGVLERDAESRLLQRGGVFGNTDLRLDGRRSYASQIFETTAVNIKYSAVNDRSIVLFEKPVGLPGQERAKLVRYELGNDGKVRRTEEGDSPKVSLDDLKPIHNRITGGDDAGFVLQNSRSWTTGQEVYTSGEDSTVFRNAAELQQQLVQLQDNGNLPAIVLVSGNHTFFGGAGVDPNDHGSHVINIQSIRKESSLLGRTRWVVELTNQWGIRSNKTITVEQLFDLTTPPRRATA